MTIGDFLSNLKIIALEYDKSYGCYPESEFEGLEFYRFALEFFGLETCSRIDKIIQENKDLYEYH